MLTQEYLVSIISYCPDSGLFKWRTRRPGTHRIEAGHKSRNGYVQIGINKKSYLGHRLAWLYMTGEMPKNLIDHIDGNPANNAWKNLREATHSQNEMNRGFSKNNRLGIKGVMLTKHGTFRAFVVKDKKQYTKRFKKLEEAEHFAKTMRAKLHGEFLNDGEKV